MATGLSKAHFEARSEFRHQLRRFERFGEEAAQAAGLTFAQYLLLLHVKGMPGRAWAVVGELAERLQLRHHTTVELVARCETAGLVRRRADPEDARRVRVLLTAKGDRLVQRVALEISHELEVLLEHLRAALPDKAPPKPAAPPAAAKTRSARTGSRSRP
jgi:DNA-binding MarR family transcriptional regulator